MSGHWAPEVNEATTENSLYLDVVKKLLNEYEENQKPRGSMELVTKNMSMTRGCMYLFGERWYGDSAKPYLLDSGIFAMFSESTGVLECFKHEELLYPINSECKKGSISFILPRLLLETDNINYDNCFKWREKVVAGVSLTQVTYYRSVRIGYETPFIYCFRVKFITHSQGVKCPNDLLGFKIDVRNFQFRSPALGGKEGKEFFRSPTVKQYMHLKSINHPSVIETDDYNYDSHENDYF